MTVISNEVARTNYFVVEGEILGYSLKVASTFVHAHVTGAKKGSSAVPHRMGITEVLEARKEGTPVHLIVRHPLDRLVSNWVFWTKKANSYIGGIGDAANKILMHAATIEEWWEEAIKHYNEHWVPQVDYHTKDGELVPNILWPIDSLDLMVKTNEDIKNRSPRTKPSWEDYYTDSFRRQMEDYYVTDVELYERSKEEWNGREAPTILRGVKWAL